MCKEFIDKLTELGIKCYQCLDTQLVWKRNDNNDNKDINNFFMIYTCFNCSDSRFVSYSKTSNIYYKNIPLFNADDNDEYMRITRLPTVRRLYDELTNTYNYINFM